MVTVLDSFEDGDISEYGGDTGSFSVSSSAPVYEGTYSLQTSSENVAITRTDVTIAPGETPFGAWNYGATYSPSLAVYARSNGFVWAVPSVTGDSNLSGYSVYAEYASSGEIRYKLFRYDNGSATVLISSIATVPKNTWHKINVTQWTSAGDITVEIVNTNGNVVGSGSMTDDAFGSGGIGWKTDGGTTTAAFDYAFKPTGLVAPSNVQITDAATEDELTLDWDSVSGTAGYYVYRAQASGSTKSDYTQVADVTGPPYTDTGLEDGEQYYYRVSSHD